MRAKVFRILSLLVLLLLCLSGCGGQTGREAEGFRLYFPVTRNVSYGSALGTQIWEGDDPTPEQLLNASRKKRIAQGSGTTVEEVNRLLKQFDQIKKMMKQFADMGRMGGKRGRGFGKKMKLPF